MRQRPHVGLKEYEINASTGSFARLLAHLLAPLTHLLAPLRSFAHLLAHSLNSELMGKGFMSNVYEMNVSISYSFTPLWAGGRCRR